LRSISIVQDVDVEASRRILPDVERARSTLSKAYFAYVEEACEDVSRQVAGCGEKALRL